MNRYVVRTSLVWAAIVALVVAAFLHRGRRPGSSRENATSVQPIATGTAQGTGNAATNTAASVPIPLAPVHLSDAQQQAIGLTTGTAEYKDVPSEVDATGTVAIDERLVSYVQVQFTGYIRKVFANATYQHVKRGDPLFTIYSPDLYATEQEYLQARDNERTLGRSSIEGVAQTSSDLVRAAEQRLRLWNLPEETLTRLEQAHAPQAEVTIHAPSSGYITDRAALPNVYVEPSTKLYTLADLSHVWVNAQVFQEDLGRVKPGARAEISVDSYPGRVFSARVESVLPQVDLTTRTASVRLAVSNPGILLKPGMFVNAKLFSAPTSGLSVPASAIFNTGSRQIVFIVANDGSLRPQEVVLGARSSESQFVLKGLAPHQKIVTSANFLIDSESQLQASAGSSTETSTPLASPSQASAEIAFTTDPNPPRKGVNTFRVRLTDSKGQSVSGATVSVVLYMPAMPAMSMAAMRTAVSLIDRGSGLYEGSGELGSGGTWQVAITVTRAGSTLATKQISVTATGGM